MVFSKNNLVNCKIILFLNFLYIAQNTLLLAIIYRLICLQYENVIDYIGDYYWPETKLDRKKIVRNQIGSSHTLKVGELD